MIFSLSTKDFQKLVELERVLVRDLRDLKLLRLRDSFCTIAVAVCVTESLLQDKIAKINFDKIDLVT